MAGKDAARRGRFSRARAITVGAVFAIACVGLAMHGGFGTLSSLGLSAVAYLCPLGALETLLAAKTAVPRTVIALIVAVIVIALLGRAFCAWVCPVPPIRRFFRPEKKGGEGAADADARGGQLGRDLANDPEGAPDPVPEDAAAAGSSGTFALTDADRDAIRAQAAGLVGHGCAGCLPPVGGKRDGLRIDSRHGVLAGALLGSAVFGFPVFCLVCPVGLTFATAICLYRAFAEQDPTISLLVFPAILLVELVLFRRWCHALCPLGVLMSLIGQRAPLAKPRVDATACLRSRGVDCHVCVDACPERLDPHGDRLGECTRCGACVEACPAQAVTLGRARRALAAHDAAPARKN